MGIQDYYIWLTGLSTDRPVMHTMIEGKERVIRTNCGKTVNFVSSTKDNTLLQHRWAEYFAVECDGCLQQSE